MTEKLSHGNISMVNFIVALPLILVMAVSIWIVIKVMTYLYEEDYTEYAYKKYIIYILFLLAFVISGSFLGQLKGALVGLIIGLLLCYYRRDDIVLTMVITSLIFLCYSFIYGLNVLVGKC